MNHIQQKEQTIQCSSNKPAYWHSHKLDSESFLDQLAELTV